MMAISSLSLVVELADIFEWSATQTLLVWFIGWVVLVMIEHVMAQQKDQITAKGEKIPRSFWIIRMGLTLAIMGLAALMLSWRVFATMIREEIISHQTAKADEIRSKKGAVVSAYDTQIADLHARFKSTDPFLIQEGKLVDQIAKLEARGAELSILISKEERGVKDDPSVSGKAGRKARWRAFVDEKNRNDDDIKVLMKRQQELRTGPLFAAYQKADSVHQTAVNEIRARIASAQENSQSEIAETMNIEVHSGFLERFRAFSALLFKNLGMFVLMMGLFLILIALDQVCFYTIMTDKPDSVTAFMGLRSAQHSAQIASQLTTAAETTARAEEQLTSAMKDAATARSNRNIDLTQALATEAEQQAHLHQALLLRLRAAKDGFETLVHALMSGPHPMTQAAARKAAAAEIDKRVQAILSST